MDRGRFVRVTEYRLTVVTSSQRKEVTLSRQILPNAHAINGTLRTVLHSTGGHSVWCMPGSFKLQLWEWSLEQNSEPWERNWQRTRKAARSLWGGGKKVWDANVAWCWKRLLLLSYQVVSNSFVASWTIAYQVPLSMGFPRQEYWSGLSFLLQRIYSLRDWTWVSCFGMQVLYHWTIWEGHWKRYLSQRTCIMCLLKNFSLF